MLDSSTKKKLLKSKNIARNWNCSFTMVSADPVVFKCIPRRPVAIHYMVRRLKQVWHPAQLRAFVRIKRGVTRDTKYIEPGETTRDVVTCRVTNLGG